MRRLVRSWIFSFVVLCCSVPLSHGDPLPEKCMLVPVNGECKAMMVKYFFDRKSGRCAQYFYDGCGPVVPFETLGECRALCESAGSSGAPAVPPVERSDPKKRSGLDRDPVEDDPRYVEVFRTIDDEVKESLASDPRRGGEGFVNIYWEAKKRLLKQKYGIDWRSPGEMNPHVIFD
jgi:hypothetical protein